MKKLVFALVAMWLKEQISLFFSLTFLEVIFTHFWTNITGNLLKPFLANQEIHDSKYPMIFTGNQPMRWLDCTSVDANK